MSKTEKLRWKVGKTQRVKTKRVVPNDWNMNKMDPQMYEKTKRVIQETLEEAELIPPIIARPHPRNRNKKLQIIDGEHRWRIIQDLGYDEIDVLVMDVSDKRAMSMTSELNYNRGTPDPEKYPEYLARMLREFPDVDMKWIADRQAETVEEIQQTLSIAGIKVERIEVPNDDMPADDKDPSQTDALLEVKFNVRQGAGEVIERELARIGKKLKGKNVRGRALEYMAVLSSQSPLDDIADERVKEDDDEDDDVSTVKIDKKKKKKKKKREKDE